MKGWERMNNEKARENFKKGYEQGLRHGKNIAFVMKEDNDGCTSCAFEDVNSWEMPCDRCKRNSKDYWRAKVE